MYVYTNSTYVHMYEVTASVLYTYVYPTALVSLLLHPSNLTALTAPSPPVRITVFGVNSTSLYVTWAVPELPRGIIEFYQVEYSSICSATTRMNTTANSTHTYLSGLSPFTEYTVHVRAFTVEFGNFSVERRRMTSEAGELKLNMNAHIHVQYAHIRICTCPHTFAYTPHITF